MEVTSSCLPKPLRRSAMLAAAVVGACAITASSAGALSPRARGGDAFGPQIIDGQEASIEQTPWLVYIEGGPFEESGQTFTTSCGGAILDTTHILTAAHCVDVEGTTTPQPPQAYEILAGDSHDYLESPTMELRSVAGIRRDPYYSVSPVGDDVAILTLAQPLSFSSAVQPIALVAGGATPAPGTTLAVSGFGKEEGALESNPNGNLHLTALTTIDARTCLEESEQALQPTLAVNSAVVLCAQSPTSATCQGDSGSPVTEGNPAVQVGVVDLGPAGCPTGKPDIFTNVAAPEIRAFIEGSETPPRAPRPASPPALKSVGPAPAALSPLTCEPGGWSGSPTFTYTFQPTSATAPALQGGAGNVFALPAGLVGTAIVCAVQASNAGGVATDFSAASPPVAADAPPSAALTAVSCHAPACTLSLTASDPNGLALTVTATVAYKVTAKCHTKKGRKKQGKRPVCHSTHTAALAVSSPSPGAYSAAAAKLPLGEPIVFTASVTNAAGLHPTTPLARSITLHKPKNKKKKR
ncbi:MAG TPA: serine protease [Solirubrobacteraceae bacterium]|nr:serine protease [Solirubrobacteraceae bacterium]